MFMSNEEFQKHLDENPQMYKMFERFALEAARYRPRFSARAIFERMRWETLVTEKSASFKINNNWVPNYALKFMQDNPEYNGFFEMRQKRTETESK
jgi:hypothetical protein